MEMKELITRWVSWLKSATTSDEEHPLLEHVHTDGKQMWASDGYRLHALEVATAKRGRVTLNEDGLFQVEETDRLLPFADLLPDEKPVLSLVIDAELLRQAVAEQEGMVQINLYGSNKAVELSSAGKYALVMPVTKVGNWLFWRPQGKE